MWYPDDPKEGLAAAAGKTGPQATTDNEWDLLGAVTLRMPISGRSSKVGVIQRLTAVDGANNRHVLRIAFVTNNNNKCRLQWFKFSPTGALLAKHVIATGDTDDLNSNSFWKWDGFAAWGEGSDVKLIADCHQIPGQGGFNRAGSGGSPDDGPAFIIPGVWTPTATGAPVAFAAWPTPVPGHVAFSDVPTVSALWPEAEIAAQLNIAGGHPDGSLGAREPLDKLHAVAMIVRAAHAVYTLLSGGTSAQSAGKK